MYVGLDYWIQIFNLPKSQTQERSINKGYKAIKALGIASKQNFKHMNMQIQAQARQRAHKEEDQTYPSLRRLGQQHQSDKIGEKASKHARKTTKHARNKIKQEI